MGSAQIETESLKVPEKLADRERPRHGVHVDAFAAGVFEITRSEYQAFVTATGHKGEAGCYSRNAAGARANLADADWRSPGFAQGDREPAVCIGWPDAKAYAAWLAELTSKPYRLLTESEWEYAARAGTETPWFWGANRDHACQYGNMPNSGSGTPVDPASTGFVCQDGFPDTAPVGSFRENAFGLHDMLGNVWEWVEDCLHDSYVGAPVDGSAWIDEDACGVHVVRGGGWSASQTLPRSAARSSDPLSYRGIGLGFRVGLATRKK
jgi:formylglycine-generating enzyme required for sulfatase activity